MTIAELFIPYFPILLLCWYLKPRVFPQLWKHAERGIIGLMLLDFYFQILFCMRYCPMSDEGDLFLAHMLVCLLVCAMLFVVNRFAGPGIDTRNIRKSPVRQGLTLRRAVALLLVGLSPLFTLNMVLLGVGYGGVAGLYSYLGLGIDDPDAQDTGFMVTYCLVIYLVILVVSVWRMMRRRLKARSAMTLAHVASSLPPILFLRSFELNKSSVGAETFDEHLCRGFALQRQPVISLADPDIAFADGTIKLQTHDKSWKQVIAMLLGESRAVVMFEGKSDGLKWEIDNIRKHVSHKCFFVATPPESYRVSAWVTGNDSFSMWRAKHFSQKSIQHAYTFIWRQFADRMASAGIHLPEQEPGCGCLITFNSDWTVREIIRGLDGPAFFQRILSLTGDLPGRTFDYAQLQRTVETYEVSGAIDEALHHRCRRFVRIVNACLFALALLITVVLIML